MYTTQEIAEMAFSFFQADFFRPTRVLTPGNRRSGKQLIFHRHKNTTMAEILSDRQIKSLLGSVLIGAGEDQLNPNGIELRLGGEVAFHSTGEEKNLEEGDYLKVTPGESVTITSLEKIDFSPETVQSVFRNQNVPGNYALMALITPTTTMMREGITQSATKIDSGYKGTLNWGLRNSSTKDLILGFKEPIFKLTIFKLSENESPDQAYGERDGDAYQNSEGISRSKRSIPADIPPKSLVASSVEKQDPAKRLQEAGYPFNHIGTELTTLDGKFEVVSTDVASMKEEFSRRSDELSGKIDGETRTLSEKIDEMYSNVLEKMENFWDRKLVSTIGIFITVLSFLVGAYHFLVDKGFGSGTIVAVAFGTAIVSFIISVVYAKSRK